MQEWDKIKNGYESCREICGNLDHPGMAQDVNDYIDYSSTETTSDQLKVEAELQKMELTGKRILHVGIGNSSLAQRFSTKVSGIDGLTVSANEKTHANSLQIKNYRVFILSKHSREFILTLDEKQYDFIVDNNLPGFACCKYHFYLMLDNYLWALKPGGEILTDQNGMNWACLDPAFILSYSDLVGLENKFPVTVSKVTDTVYSLKAMGRKQDYTKMSTSYRLCERDGKQVIEPRSVIKTED